MLATAPAPRQATPRFRALSTRSPDHVADEPVLADLVAFVATLDLGPLQQTYRGRGSDAWPVDRLLVLALFHLHHGQPSPADWHRQAATHIHLRTLLDQRVPARSTLYAFRDRLAGPLQAIHQTWLQQHGQNCPQLGQEIGIAGTFCALQASRHNLLSENGWQRRLRVLNRRRWLLDLAGHLDGLASPLRAILLWLALACYCRQHTVDCPRRWPAWLAQTPAGRARQEQRYQHALQVLQARVAAATTQRPSRRPATARLNPSAPQAVLGRDKQHVYRPLVNAQMAVDLHTGLVTALVVVAQANDANQLLPLSQASAHNCGRFPQRATVEVGYVPVTQLRHAQQQHLEVFSSFAAAPLRASTDRAKFTAADFRWDARERVYVCPTGTRRPYRRQGSEKRDGGERVALELYQAPGAVCTTCPQAARCTTNPGKGRIIKRLAEEELRTACQQRSQTTQGEERRVARKSQVERVFGDWKEHRGQSRICGRSPQAAQAQLGLAWLYFNARSTFTRSRD